MIFYAYMIDEGKPLKQYLSDERERNIAKVFSRVLGEDGVGDTTSTRLYHTPNNPEENKLDFFGENFLDDLYNDELDKFMFSLAQDLVNAEQVIEKGTDIARRNKKIKQGILFIKQEKQRLSFLKLEQIDILDQDTFEIIDVEKQKDKEDYRIAIDYFKSAVYFPNGEVYIVDKNKTVANFWYREFLGLEKSRDDAMNTLDFVEILESDEFINHDIEKDLRSLLSSNLEKEIYNHIDSEINLSNMLMNVSKISGINSFDEIDSIFNTDLIKGIDSEFIIKKSALDKVYQKTIKISDTVTLIIDNVSIAKKKGTLIYDEGEAPNSVILHFLNDNDEIKKQLRG